MPVNKSVAVLGATLAMTMIATSAHAQSLCAITVAWDANPESFVTGYYVYVRTNGIRHEEMFNVRGVTLYSYQAAVQGSRYDISVASVHRGGRHRSALDRSVDGLRWHVRWRDA